MYQNFVFASIVSQRPPCKIVFTVEPEAPHLTIVFEVRRGHTVQNHAVVTPMPNYSAFFQYAHMNVNTILF